MKNIYITAMDYLYRIGMWISGISLLVMVIVIPIGVFGRYVLNSGYSWPEPVAIICMLIFSFIGASISYRASAHIAVSMVVDRLPKSTQIVFSKLTDLLMALVSLFIFYYGMSLCEQMWTQPIGEFPMLTAGMKYLSLPVGSFMTLLFVIERFFFGSQAKRPIVALGNAG